MNDEERRTSQTLFDTRAAADYLDVSPKTLEKLRWSGGGPAYYRLAGVRYKLADLDSWRESRRRTSTSDAGPVTA